ncbi:MAG: hypothetical protein AAFX81_18850 [Pseudomonadota bacterium]
MNATATHSLDLLGGRTLGRFIMTMLFAGALSTVAFDYFGQSLAPMLGWPNLAPVPLANQVLQVVFGWPGGYAPGAHFLHYAAGLLAYPLGWMLIVEPLRRAYAPQIHWLLAAALYGVALWVFALFVMASLIAGNPPFLGFIPLTWVALAGHVLFALVTAIVDRRDAPAGV